MKYKIHQQQNVLLFTFFSGLILTILLLLSVFRANASTQLAYTNGFEADTAGWLGSGAIDRVASGTDGIASSDGDFHAVVSGSHAGPNTQLGGYNTVWPGDWKASIDLYLDPSWDAGTGFIYSVAANRTNGTALRDFMLNAGVLNDESTGNTDTFVVLADTGGSPTSDPLYHIKAMPVERRAEITEAGWYTLEHHFQNVDGRLVVTMTLSDVSDAVVKSWTIDYEWMNDIIGTDVGGNRYGWFTHAAVPGGIAIDNVTRSITANQYNVSNDVAEPLTLTLEENQTITLLGTTGGAITTPADITIASPSNNVAVFIPTNTEITAEDSNWDGTLNAPAVTSISADTLPDKTVHFAVKVGADTPLTFSQPVRLVLPGQAGKLAGYFDASDTLHPIEAQCAADPADTLVDGVNECYMVEGDDLIIWTNHFSTYLAYSESEAALASSSTGNQPLADTGVNELIAIAVALGVLCAGGASFAAIRASASRD